MVENSAVIYTLRVARELSAARLEVISTRELRPHTERCKRVNYRRGKASKIYLTTFARDESIVKVAKIVIYSASARNTPHNLYILALGIFEIDLCFYILIFADDDRPIILPEHKDIVSFIFKEIFLGRKIIEGIVPRKA